MIKEAEPIYDFPKLRNRLASLGYVVGKAQGYREIRPEEVTLNTISKGQMEFSDEGIFVITPNGDKIQVFLYKRDYHLELYGKPRFHICKCSTIEDFIENGLFKQHYVRANTDPVPVCDLDNHRHETKVGSLPLCKNCMDMIWKYGKINSSEFVELLKQVRREEEEETKEVDIFGYTRDWEQISRDYKKEQDYTCEECGIKIYNAFDQQFIHCHHIDGNKLNNRKSNLRCLCIRCHAQVDDTHQKNLSSGANKIILDEFNKRYGNLKLRRNA